MHTRPGRGGKPAKRCEACSRVTAAASAERRRRMRLEGLNRGLCTVCGGDRDRPEVQLCADCRQTNSKHVRTYQRKLSLPRRRRAARKRLQINRADRARETARRQADTLLRQLSDGLLPRH